MLISSSSRYPLILADSIRMKTPSFLVFKTFNNDIYLSIYGIAEFLLELVDKASNRIKCVQSVKPALRHPYPNRTITGAYERQRTLAPSLTLTRRHPPGLGETPPQHSFLPPLTAIEHIKTTPSAACRRKGGGFLYG